MNQLYIITSWTSTDTCNLPSKSVKLCFSKHLSYWMITYSFWDFFWNFARLCLQQTLIQASLSLGFPGGSDGKNPPALRDTCVWSLCWEYLLEQGMATSLSLVLKHDSTGVSTECLSFIKYSLLKLITALMSSALYGVWKWFNLQLPGYSLSNLAVIPCTFM